MGRDERGMALVLALFVVAMLVVLVLEFDRMTRTDLLAAGNFRDGLKAGYLAKAGVEVARSILKGDALRGGPYDGLDEVWTSAFPPLRAGDGSITIAVQDEEGKLNPNHLVGGPGGQKIPTKVTQMRRLMESLGLDARLVDAMVDWLDADDDPEPFGAEAAYYAGLEPPYRAKNGPLESLSELHLISGFTDEVCHRLGPYLTVSTPSPGKININTADPVVLRTLDPRISRDLAERIVKARPFQRLDDLDKVAGMEQIAKELRAIEQTYDIRSDTFLIVSRGEVQGTVRMVLATVVRTQSSLHLPTVLVRTWRME